MSIGSWKKLDGIKPNPAEHSLLSRRDRSILESRRTGR